MDDKYTVTIYVAAPGTPLLAGGTSAAGHVYFKAAHGKDETSFGFAPIEHGVTTGPGMVYYNDVEQYEKPYYQRTMEISKEQYEKLNEFGAKPGEHGFNTSYHGLDNSCIDYTWGALNHAGLHRTNLLFVQDKNFEGGLKPLTNVEYIRSIRAPFPDSDLNTEHYNEMPERTLMQRIISEEQLQGDDRLMHEAIRKGVAGIDEEHGRTPDETSERLAPGLLATAKESRLVRVDHVLLGNAPGAQPAQQPGSLRADPLQPGGADYALHQQIRAGVAALDAQYGRAPDAVSDRMTASLLVLAKENDLSRVDQVVLSAATVHQPAGHTVFLIKGDLSSAPFALATMTTDRAVATPVEVSMQRYQQMNQEAQLQTAARQVEQQAQDGRVQGMGIG
ncbi:XVIPCD domain-containing protein [Stenotrophomonas sp. NPDC077659]|uniref:XVIPCD domain-containing protein n=1 Tax=Stenotrophomonas sp. NPDC077659 TaxID=3390694 RepID=UPI003CFFE4EE